ncbi:YqaE/Pmp3 family membrane protein [Rhodotorula paludigena]|uniref:YqaE/Pmp3 family membrane protein n=1 Tax=Rhodotorula paludigena TaxID=86838 RepID=UPI0031778B5D
MAAKSSTSEMCLYFLAIFLPPIAMCFRLGRGIGACDILINILLCILGWIPGVIHAWWTIGRSARVPPRVAAVRHY